MTAGTVSLSLTDQNNGSIESIVRRDEQRRNSIREPERAAAMLASDEAAEKFCRLAAGSPEGS